MIIVIDSINKDRFGDLLDEMFRLRARVFGDRLGWEVHIENGMEIDSFDALDPAYVIGVDDSGHVVACARLLQTTGPHMLSDVFDAILDGEPPLRSANVWESTRFCVDTQRLKTETTNAISKATSELMIGTLEYARAAGITDIVTVIDPIMDRVLKRSDNAPYGYLGSKKPMGKVEAMAALLECSLERIARIRAFAQITTPVFVAEDVLRELLDARLSGLSVENVEVLPTRTDILEYCESQLSAAQTPAEKNAAMELIRAITGERPQSVQDARLSGRLH